jgi:hypothetical protein
MMRIWSVAAAALFVVVNGGCASHKESAPVQAAPAPVRVVAPAPADFSGEWAWSASVGGNMMDGAMHLDHATTPTAYTGTLTAQGMALPVKDFEVSGKTYTFKVEGPDGIYTLKGLFTDDKTMEGTLDGPPGPGSFKAKKN